MERRFDVSVARKYNAAITILLGKSEATKVSTIYSEKLVERLLNKP